MPRPDIRAFWEQNLAALAAVSADVEVKPMPDLSYRDYTVDRVRLRSFENRWLRGWLAQPRYRPGQRPLPAILVTPGYQGDRPIPVGLVQRGFVVLMLYPRAQGESRAEWELPRDTKLTYFLTDRQQYYYRGAYLDCIRGLDFLANCEGVDSDRIGMWGRSQGGAFTLATAVLDRRVRAAVAEQPFLCNFPVLSGLSSAPSVELAEWLAAHPEQRQAAMATLEYFDVLNLVDGIDCPILVSVGLADEICPARAILPMADRITALKGVLSYPGLGHAPCADFNRHAEAWLDRYLSA